MRAEHATGEESRPSPNGKTVDFGAVVESGPTGSEGHMAVLVYYQRVPERIEPLDFTCVFSLGEGGK